MSADPSIRDHQTWLNYLQPDGLVVSPAALVDAQVLLPHNALPLQERFLPFVEEFSIESDKAGFAIKDFVAFCCDFLEWPDDCLFGGIRERSIPESLIVSLPEFGLTLSPSLAFRDPNPKDAEKPWLLLAQNLPLGTDLDAHKAEDERGWKASHSRRFERLLRETKVPIGLLNNGTHIRLIYAPHGENSGSITFPVAAMTEVAGRSILAAFQLLLDRYRLLAAPTDVRLPALLSRSREYQSRVSAALAEQVLDSLYELQRGFQAANERTAGELLRSVLAERPDDVYAGLLTVLMRLVFLLFAEDRGLMPTSELYVRNYSIHGLFERLRSDNEHYPDTIDQRYGAWAQLLAVFRSVYHGSRHPQLHMPARHGHLFDPNRFTFLDGRLTAEGRVPLVSDGTIFRILEKLLILAGERLSYRSLDVEEIGSVYQTVMGFRLEIASGPSIAIQGKKKHKSEVAAPSVINLNELLAVASKDRVKWLKGRTNQEFTGEAEKTLKLAVSPNELLAALERKIARNATPIAVAADAMVLQPTDERRRSGSHYTPRSFTEPIVRKTLAPILDRLGEQPTQEEILELKVCDLAVGSGAFLVEACRQLGDALVKAWQHHGDRPALPPYETDELLARRIVAQRCLYALDRNPMAADLAKLSLWLVTLAKDHPFTFLDHSIRVGDALVGLTRQQIADFHWLSETKRAFDQDKIESRVRCASAFRKRILEAGDFLTPEKKQEQLELADEALKEVRFVGNMVISAFFSATTDRARRARRDELLARYTEALRKNDFTVGLEEIKYLMRGKFPVTPFHWEIEFPEVFARENSGFDAIVGNPPFAGKNSMASANVAPYSDWMKEVHEETHGNADLVAHFYRRAFELIRKNGTFGLIATNTIAQGDTRTTGLRWICQHGGDIFCSRKRVKWPGAAAVVVSIVHVIKGTFKGSKQSNDREVDLITAFLFHRGSHEDPKPLAVNLHTAFIGYGVYGAGFTFEDGNPEANPLSEVPRLFASNDENRQAIFSYLGGEEFMSSATLSPTRYVINFGQRTLEEVERRWPELLSIVREKVKPYRDSLPGKNSTNLRRSTYWWQFGAFPVELDVRINKYERVLFHPNLFQSTGFGFIPAGTVVAAPHNVILLDRFAGFAILQSRAHEVWAKFFGSSMKDDPRYTPTTCFETFPFPENWTSNSALETAGESYDKLRSAIMIKKNDGLTKTHNRFHDPDETSTDIQSLRELHAAMDQAVLESYGWHDLAKEVYCEFLLDYEDEENEDDGRIRKRKKPWRYRWPDDFRDEVLARLLALNTERAEQEHRAALAEELDGTKKGKRSRRKQLPSNARKPLFE